MLGESVSGVIGRSPKVVNDRETILITERGVKRHNSAPRETGRKAIREADIRVELVNKDL